MLPAGSTLAQSGALVSAGAVSCCAIDGDMVATARHDGTVCVKSCEDTLTSAGGCAGRCAWGAPLCGGAAASSRVPCAIVVSNSCLQCQSCTHTRQLQMTRAAAAGLPSALADFATAAPPCTPADPDASRPGSPASAGLDMLRAGAEPMCKEAKLEMLAYGASLCCQLGRVAVVGCERKQEQAQVAVLCLWEWDPVPLLLSGGSGGGGGYGGSYGGPGSPRAGALAGAGRLGSGALLASAESRLPSAPGPGAGTPAGALGGAATPSSCGSAYGGRAASAGGGAGGGGAVGGLLAKRENPLKVVVAPEGGPLTCCAWAPRGERALVAAGSSAGWLVVVDLTKEEDEAQVRGFALLQRRRFGARAVLARTVLAFAPAGTRMDC